jgi:hypothetical protein
VKIYLQGAAFAALAYAIAQPAWADEVVVANENSDTGILGQIVVAQATPAAPDSTPTAVSALAQAATTVVAQAATSAPEQVLVTAFKRETLLQETPIAIAVVNT